MFSEKNVHPRSRSAHFGYGVLILLVLSAGVVGCSSSETETDKLYGSEEAMPGSQKDQSASLAPSKETGMGSTSPAPLPAVYSPADQSVVLKYAEKGEGDAGNVKAALKLVQRAEQLPPAKRLMEDYLVLAAHYRMKGEMNKVVQYANQGIMAKSDSSRVKANMFIYLGYTYEDKSPTMALSYFKQAAKMDPGFYKSHYELGRMSYLKKNFPDAQVQLKKALGLTPNDAEVYGMLGQMFHAMDQYEEAAVSFEKALELSPQTHWLLVKLADTYFYGLKQREKGRDFYQKAIATNRADPEAHYGMAVYYRSKDKFAKAEEELQKAITTGYKNPKYKRELEDLRSEKIEMAEEIEKHKRAIEENPGDPSNAAKLGRFYLRWQKHDLAEELFKKAIEMSTTFKAKEKSAGEDEEPVAKGGSRVPEYASTLGWFYFNDKKYAKSEEAFQLALKVNPKYTEALFGLGRAYESLKQYELAASQYAQTLAMNSKHTAAQERLAALKTSGLLLPVVEVEQKPVVAPDKQTVEEVKK